MNAFACVLACPCLRNKACPDGYSASHTSLSSASRFSPVQFGCFSSRRINHGGTIRAAALQVLSLQLSFSGASDTTSRIVDF